MRKTLFWFNQLRKMELELKLVPDHTSRDEYRVLKNAKLQQKELEENYQRVTLFGNDTGSDDDEEDHGYKIGKKKVILG
jgi:hypothetical protein